MKRLILTGCSILIIVSVVKAQNYPDSSIITFRSYINKLVEKINNRDSSYEYYSGIVDSLQQLQISSLPEFKKIVYDELPLILKKWEREKPTIDYVVKPGDNLWDIAKRKSVYDNPHDWKKILLDNKNNIMNPNLIVPLQTLRIRNPIFVQEIIKDTSLYASEDTLRTFTGEISGKTFKDIEVEGLIVDQTQTKVGHDFYDLFYSNWQQPENSGDYTIVIEEKPLPQLGTQVTIKINDNEIFQQILQPRYDVIEATAQYGVEVTINYIQNYQVIQKQLAGDDLRGSGIF